MAKLTVKQLKQLKSGCSLTIKADHPTDLNSTRALCSYTSLTYPELGVRFKASINRIKLEVVVTAISTKDESKRVGRKSA